MLAVAQQNSGSSQAQHITIGKLGGAVSRMIEARAGEAPIPDRPEVPAAQVTAEVKTTRICTGDTNHEIFWGIEFSMAAFDLRAQRLVTVSTSIHEIPDVAPSALSRVGSDDLWKRDLRAWDSSLQSRWQRSCEASAADALAMARLMSRVQSDPINLQTVLSKDFDEFVSLRLGELVHALRVTA